MSPIDSYARIFKSFKKRQTIWFLIIAVSLFLYAICSDGNFTDVLSNIVICLCLFPHLMVRLTISKEETPEWVGGLVFFLGICLSLTFLKINIGISAVILFITFIVTFFMIIILERKFLGKKGGD